MTPYELFLQPFVDYGFMRRALAACTALAISGAPLGVFLVLRRMALVGDAMSHAILPGVALAFIFFGLAVIPMTLGGIIAGLLVALIAGGLTRFTAIKEDASFTAMFTLSLAAGVMLISQHGTALDLMHILFGNVLAVDKTSLYLITATTTFSTLILACLYRSLVVECFDPGFLRAANGHGGIAYQLFLLLLVLNLVAAFQTIGTLMAMGVMVLPAIASRFWTSSVDSAMGLSIVFAVCASIAGLLLSYHWALPSSPAIVLTSGVIYSVSVLVGWNGSLAARFLPRKHFAS
jgi:zinc/manganese transport system permease protein